MTETTQEATAGVPAVGRRIREARIAAGMTQDDLAGHLGVTQTCVSYWEAAKRDPGAKDLLRIAEAVGVPASSLLPAPELARPGAIPPAVTSFCSLCGSTEPADLGKAIGICLNAEACHRRQARNREHRQYVAEEIARAIEDSVCAPGDQCAERFCPDCTRWRQCQADAALARKIGENR